MDTPLKLNFTLIILVFVNYKTVKDRQEVQMKLLKEKIEITKETRKFPK